MTDRSEDIGGENGLKGQRKKRSKWLYERKQQQFEDKMKNDDETSDELGKEPGDRLSVGEEKDGK